MTDTSKALEQEPSYYPPCIDCNKKMDEIRRAYDKLKEQEPILDKIRAKIEKYKSTIDNAISEDELKIEGMKEAYTDCLKIIDKYKEGEE